MVNRFYWPGLLLLISVVLNAQPAPSGTSVGALTAAIRAKAKALEGSSGMRLGYQSFTEAQELPPGTVSYSDYTVARLLFEAARAGGFWNLHWKITSLPPDSTNIWRQWKAARSPSPLKPTATAECDELSALYAFLAGKAGVKGIGLFWPAPNHTVAVWVLQPPHGRAVRVVVPTTQIFLRPDDRFGTRRFNPWSQKSIFEYRRRDVPDSFELPKPLFDFLLEQVDKYAGASDGLLQKLRYLREDVLLGLVSRDAAAREAEKFEAVTREDEAAVRHFASDMRGREAKAGRSSQEE